MFNSINPFSPAVMTPTGAFCTFKFFPEDLSFPVAACPHDFVDLFLSIPSIQTHKNIFKTLLKVSLEVYFPSLSYLLPSCHYAKDTVSLHQQN